MARYGATLTVASGKITGTVNLAWYLNADCFPVAAIDGGATSILNGGGNLRAYTDNTKATRLPIQIVTFVTGGTPNIEVWGLSDLAVGSTVYIEADTVETSQPAVTNAFGRNAVYPNDVTRLHLESSGDSATGANDFGDLVASPSYSAGEIGGSLDTSAGNIGTLSFPALASNDVRISFLVKPNNLTANQYICGGGNGNFNGAIVGYQIGYFNVYTGSYPTGNPVDTQITATIGEWQRVTFTSDGTTIKGFKNGAEIFSVAGSLKTTATDYYLGTYRDTGPGRLDGLIDEFIYSNEYVTAGKEQAEYNNQSDPAGFFEVGAWEDQDAVGGGFIAAWARNANKLINMAN
ncbi:LamG-like jellyroll fold domain-containing protein [Pseudoalteromonas sp.]|uniref:LamG-like jellyroll fold domain-containing protein n=1 Tax=Pseudoalteromonas sp. TaxID=53249 RepID=UPI00356566D8